MLRLSLFFACLALVGGLGFADVLQRSWSRPLGLPVASAGALATSPPSQAPRGFAPSSGPFETLDADRYGQFHAEVLIDGRRFPVMVDTGATFVVLAYEDATALGIHLNAADFRFPARTANGTSYQAYTRLRRISLGNLSVDAVDALVAQPGVLSGGSLLGMSFLRRLSSYRVEADRLFLVQ